MCIRKSLVVYLNSVLLLAFFFFKKKKVDLKKKIKVKSQPKYFSLLVIASIYWIQAWVITGDSNIPLPVLNLLEAEHLGPFISLSRSIFSSVLSKTEFFFMQSYFSLQSTLRLSIFRI